MGAIVQTSGFYHGLLALYGRFYEIGTFNWNMNTTHGDSSWSNLQSTHELENKR
jgi:hypothetical protein